ncbi:deubiquitinase DESI2-like isoform X2 [Teleopsis dalmanni]|uniref:deubiquitinase DESI2-like isoform X2 n=1 Tax=Teleopsis dalmanni TaxID=139649 RepID=UPI0018CFC039|nr:deubiquitinase DESI2-like isoform X2 [Teleopsis dalmanni]
MQTNKQKTSTQEPVFLNIYDLNWINGYTNILGFGIYHTGVEVYGKEYCFGGHCCKASGIFIIPPRNERALGTNVRLRQSMRIGATSLSDHNVEELIDAMGTTFSGSRYHLIQNNCNHFSNALTNVLCGIDIPSWINRLARFFSNAPLLKKCLPSDWLTPTTHRSNGYESHRSRR